MKLLSFSRKNNNGKIIKAKMKLCKNEGKLFLLITIEAHYCLRSHTATQTKHGKGTQKQNFNSSDLLYKELIAVFCSCITYVDHITIMSKRKYHGSFHLFKISY